MDTDGTSSAGPAAGEVNARRELLLLVRSLRAHLEGLEDTGAWGVPSALRRSGELAPAARAARPAGSPPPAPPAVGHSPAERAAERSPAAVATPVLSSPGAGAAEGALVPEARTRLESLADVARSCTRCPLHAGRHHSVFSRGNGSSGVVFVGEGPGEEEDRQGSPFVGPAGQLLDRMIAAMQLSRDDVYVCNIVKCRPPKNRKPEPAEMASCMPFLAEQLELVAPRVIVALGATAVLGLLGSAEGITRMRGQWKSYRGIPVMPTFHPAYLLRTPAAKRDVWRDLQEVLRRLHEA